MNYSKAVFLINDAARAITCSYETGHPDGTFKTLDPDIQKDDLVVVPTTTRHGFTVVKVVNVDVNINLDSTEEIPWIVDRVDIESHNVRVEKETAAIEKVKSAEHRRKRAELLESLQLDQEAMEDLKLVAAPAADDKG